MRKHGKSSRNGRGRPGVRPGTRAVALVAAFALVMSMCPGAAALAFANGQMAAGSDGLEEQSLSAQAEDVIIVNEETYYLTTGHYKVNRNVERGGNGGNGLQIQKGAKVHLEIEKGCTYRVGGAGAIIPEGVGHAAILLPEGAVLVVSGEGTLIAGGGTAQEGQSGQSMWLRERCWAEGSEYKEGGGFAGKGGAGANGGGGAGAGIGTNGGPGGRGGEGADKLSVSGLTRTNVYGNEGKAGEAGHPADPAGTLIVTGSATVIATGGEPHWDKYAAGGGDKGSYGQYIDWFVGSSAGTSGGGGGGGDGSAADGIGSGGTGGGGGGGGASGNIDGECAYFYGCDLDNLWGHGGSGGSSNWGGLSGKPGAEGANGGDDTDASKKYAKSGGAGGSCVAPKPVAFYTYKGSPSDNPKVICTSGNGLKREATPLKNTSAIAGASGLLDKISGGTSTYDGKPHGAAVSGGGVRAQAGGEGDEWPDEGTVEIDGVVVSYSIAYYDEEGNELGSEPVMPGQYAAVVTFACDDPDVGADYTGSWVETVTIAKRQVEKPTPAALVFDCADWETAAGKVQDAFPDLDETRYEFVEASKGAGEAKVASARSASKPGEYEACFRLKDPELDAWAGESEDADEVWVPWSMAPQPYDLASKEVTYWGTAFNDETTSLAYTGEPVWVRPWFTPEKGTDGRFPDWATHWGSADRPTTDRSSAFVVYLDGTDDDQGLVGYHTNPDGTLEKVTAAQVYAWAAGVDIGGTHRAVESGERVWYRTGEDGWWVPIAVQEARPAGAEGFVVARDYAYADKLGVMEAGTYTAYALLDDAAGFAPTSLAEAAVKVGDDLSGAEVRLAEAGYTYDGKAKEPAVKSVKLGGKELKAGADYAVSYSGNVDAGTATATVTGRGGYYGSAKATFAIAKAAQAISAKGCAATAKAKKQGKKKVLAKAVTVDLAKKAKVSAKTAVSYAKANKAGGKKIAVSKAGKVTLKKGLKKGTYKVDVKLTAPEGKNYKAAKAKTITLTVKVK